MFCNFIPVIKPKLSLVAAQGSAGITLLYRFTPFCVFIEGANSMVRSSLELAEMTLISHCLNNFTAFLILPMIISRNQGIR